MPSAIHHMGVVRYYRDGRPWDSEDVLSPNWANVEGAVRRMDNYCFPIVTLHTNGDEDDDTYLNIIGGDGRWAMFHVMGEWQYEDPAGSEEEVRLWESDQGYFCKAKNVLVDVEEVLRLAKAFYDSGSYEKLGEVAAG